MKRIYSTLPLAVILSGLVCGQAVVTTFGAFKGAAPTICQIPTYTNSFVAADGFVRVYFEINGVNTGDVVELRWFTPSSYYRWRNTWAPDSNGGNHCYWAALDTATEIPPDWGTWRAQVYINNQYTNQETSFDIEQTIQPRGPQPDYHGYFEPIDTDCSHLHGWAKDNNSSGTINVDIAVSGFSKVTLAAGDPRSDSVGPHGWNLYNLQQYEDGTSHQVHVYYGGTLQELDNSPLTFPPPNAQSSCHSTPPPTAGFVVGDRVGLTINNPDGNTILMIGDQGSVVCLFPAGSNYDLYVDWDKTVSSSSGFGSCSNVATVGHGWAVKKEWVQKVNGGAAPLTVSWVSGAAPPSTMTSGQSVEVKWQVAGPSQIQSRLCFGTSSDPATMCQQSGKYFQTTGMNTSGLSLDTITAPTTASQQTIYALVQAQASGQTIYTQPAIQIVVSPAVPSGPAVPTWTYSNDPNLRGLVLVVQRQATGSSYQYRFNIISKAGFASDIATAHLTMVAPHDSTIKVHRTSLSAGVIYDGVYNPDSIVQSPDTAPWRTVSQAWNNWTTLAKDILGFVPLVGDVLSVDQLIKDAEAAANLIGGIGPSSSLNDQLGSDDYDVYGTDVSIGPFLGVRISVNVDQFASSMPHFFLTIKESGTTVVGIELQDIKVSGCPSNPQTIGSNGACWAPWVQAVN
jgi:hypothetical protein